MNPTSPQAETQEQTRAALVAAAAAALPIGETEAQAYGTRQPWGTYARPGRIEARARALRVLVRAAERAMQARPSLDVRHFEAALRSLALSPSDLLVCNLSGEWLSTREAVANRGHEISRALEELALIVAAVESGDADHG